MRMQAADGAQDDGVGCFHGVRACFPRRYAYYGNGKDGEGEDTHTELQVIVPGLTFCLFSRLARLNNGKPTRCSSNQPLLVCLVFALPSVRSTEGFLFFLGVS